MKKVLTFILAAAMAVGMATSAMAYTTSTVTGSGDSKVVTPNIQMQPNEKTGTITLDGVAMEAALVGDMANIDAAVDGGDLVLSGVQLTMFGTGGTDKLDVEYTTGTCIPDDFNISASVKKGSDVVKATVKKDDKKVEIKVVPNYAWSTTKQADFKVEIKFASKKSTHMPKATLTVIGTVAANGEWATVKDVKTIEDLSIPYDGSYIVKWGDPTEDVTVEFSRFESLVDMDVYMFFNRISDQGAINLFHNNEPDGYKDIRKANIDADVRFINFPAKPVFDVAGKFVIAADRDEYIYEIVSGNANALSVNGAYRADSNITLVKGNFTWDDSEGGWAKRTNKLGAYAISDKELEVTTIGTGASTGTGTVTNPGTGANDMVNVAVALAVVSLAAAGAVAFKRASK